MCVVHVVHAVSKRLAMFAHLRDYRLATGKGLSDPAFQRRL